MRLMTLTKLGSHGQSRPSYGSGKIATVAPSICKCIRDGMLSEQTQATILAVITRQLYLAGLVQINLR